LHFSNVLISTFSPSPTSLKGLPKEEDKGEKNNNNRGYHSSVGMTTKALHKLGLFTALLLRLSEIAVIDLSSA